MEFKQLVFFRSLLMIQESYWWMLLVTVKEIVPSHVCPAMLTIGQQSKTSRCPSQPINSYLVVLSPGRRSGRSRNSFFGSSGKAYL